MDKNGYPDEQELKVIREWDVWKQGWQGLLDFIEEIWWSSDWGFRQHGCYLQLHTGGWSGNEDIMDVIHHNASIMYFWVKSTVGGHYWFKFKKELRYCGFKSQEE